MSISFRRSAPAAVLAVAAAFASAGPALAKHGAEDPAGDDRGVHTRVEDGVHHHRHGGKKAHRVRHGADDRPGHVRHGHGADDGPNHR